MKNIKIRALTILVLLLLPAAAFAQTFTRPLTQGSTGTDVTALQQILAQQGFLNNQPTGYFGAQTAIALAQFQRAHGIAALGKVGPQTRTILNGLNASSSVTLPSTSTPSTSTSSTNGCTPTLTRNLSLGSTGSDITCLQQALESLGFLSSNPTGYFGPQTSAAVKAFQASKGLDQLGSVGPKTRAALVALILGTQTNTNTSTSQPAGPQNNGGTSSGTAGSSPVVIQNYTPPVSSNGGGGGGGSSSASSGGSSSTSNGGGSNSTSSSGGGSGSGTSTATPTPTDTTPPSVTISAPPANLTANTTSTALVVSTNEAATCAYSTNSAFTFGAGTVFTTTGNLSHTSTLSPLSNSTSYTYYVKCEDVAGNVSGNASITFSVATPIDTTAPSAPTNVTATAVSSSQINLTWTASTDNFGVIGYKVFRGGVLIASPITNSYSDTGLSASTAYTYTIKAIDAASNVSTASSAASATTQAVSVGVACPRGTAYQDGCSGASAGSPQLPTMLNGYSARSPWNVAGVDYAVGVPSGTVLKDPTTAALPTGCSRSGSTVTCSGAVTLDGYDFSLHNGTTLHVTSGNVTVQNSKFVVGTNQGALGTIIDVTGSVNFTFLHNEVDGNNIGVTVQQGYTFGMYNSGTDTLRYNYLHNSGGDMLELSGGPQLDLFQYNVFKDIGYLTDHSDTIQYCQNHTAAGSDVSFNLMYQPQAGLSGMGLLVGNAGCTGGNLSGLIVHNNTLISKVTDNFAIGVVNDTGASGDHVAVFDNYTDPTGIMSFTGSPWFPVGSYGSTLPRPTILHGLTDMTTGSLIPIPSISSKTSDGYYVYPDASGYTPSFSDFYTITPSPASGTVSTGSTITFTLAMAEPWFVTGSPTFSLNSGGVATYSSGSGTNTLTFTYTVGAGQSVSNLAITAFNLNGGSIKDAVGNSAIMSDAIKTYTGLAVSGGVTADTTAPGVPTGLSASVASLSQINLTWTASSDNVAVTGYKVFRGGVQVGTSVSTSYSDSGLSAGTNYSYTVSAYDAAGNNSGQSSSASATTQSVSVVNGSCGTANGTTVTTAPTANLCSTGSVGTVSGTGPWTWSCTGTGGGTTASCSANKTTSDTTAPSVPTGLSASVASLSQINLSWIASTDNVGVTGYKIFRGGTQIGTSATNSYSNTGLSASTNYSYTVSAYDAAGNNSAQSSSASATTQATAPTATLSASATTITAGQSSTLTYSSTNATTCTGTNFTTSGTAGSVSVAPSVTTTYSMTCTGSGGSANKTVTITVSAVSSSGGSVPIPGPSNRPVYNSANNILSWSGPVGGGPSTGTYTPQTRTLTASGPVTTTAAGQIIEGLRITGSAGLDHGLITVNHNNVTIRQNSLMESTVDQGGKYTIFIAQGVTGTVIEDNEIDGNALGGDGGTSCVSGATANGPGVNGLIMRRNNCLRSEQAIRFILNNVQFTENWAHQIGGVDADWVEVYPVGGSVNNILVQYNTLDGTDNPEGGSDAGVNLTTGSGLPVGNIGPNISIDNNWFVNWSTVHALNFDNTSGGLMQFSFTNNGLYNFQDNLSPSGIVSPNSGNYIMSTPTSLTGAPLHGSGAI